MWLVALENRMECEGLKKHLKTLHFFPFLINQDIFQGFLYFSPDYTAGFVCVCVLCIFQIFYTKNYILLLHSGKKHTCTSGKKK